MELHTLHFVTVQLPQRSVFAILVHEYGGGGGGCSRSSNRFRSWSLDPFMAKVSK
jgi:hypothetical protein